LELPIDSRQIFIVFHDFAQEEVQHLRIDRGGVSLADNDPAPEYTKGKYKYINRGT
jgi:hypothetical protein